LIKKSIFGREIQKLILPNGLPTVFMSVLINKQILIQAQVHYLIADI